MENWKPVHGYEDCYEVSDFGNVRRSRTQFGRDISRPMVSGGNRYRHFALSKDGTKRTHGAHRLVWEAFVAVIPDGMQINHKNGDKHDNRLANLETCTPKENIAHSFTELGRIKCRPPLFRGEQHVKAKIKNADVPEIHRMRAEGMTYKAIAKHFNVSQSLIFGIASGSLRAYLLNQP